MFSIVEVSCTISTDSFNLFIVQPNYHIAHIRNRMKNLVFCRLGDIKLNSNWNIKLIIIKAPGIQSMPVRSMANVLDYFSDSIFSSEFSRNSIQSDRSIQVLESIIISFSIRHLHFYKQIMTTQSPRLTSYN